MTNARGKDMRFHDRAEAGRQLASALTRYQAEAPLILGIPPGGVPVAFEVARALTAPLDVLVARRIGAPGRPELEIGAIAEGGGLYIEQAVLQILRASPEDLRDSLQREREELERRSVLFRDGKPLPETEGRTVVLVDDGVATGATARAAIGAIRARRPRRLVFAVPVGSADALTALEEEVDDLVCLSRSTELRAVGACYEDFARTTDQEVLDLLARTRAAGSLKAADLLVDGL